MVERIANMLLKSAVRNPARAYSLLAGVSQNRTQAINQLKLCNNTISRLPRGGFPNHISQSVCKILSCLLLSTKITYLQSLRQLKREFRAICSLLNRSGFQVPSTSFHTSAWCAQNKSPQPPPPNEQPDKDKKPDREDDEETKMSSLLAKAFLWMLTAYLLIGVVSLLFPSSNQPEVRSQNNEKL